MSYHVISEKLIRPLALIKIHHMKQQLVRGRERMESSYRLKECGLATYVSATSL